MSGPNPILEQLRREWDHAGHAVTEAAGWFDRRHHTSAGTTAAAPTIRNNPTTEDPVSLLTDIKTDFASVAAKLEQVDTEAIEKFDAIKANPEAAAVLDVLAQVATAELPSGLIKLATTGLNELVRYATTAEPAPSPAPADVPQPAPAGPVVAGQA